MNSIFFIDKEKNLRSFFFLFQKGIIVFSTSVRLAEKITAQREFIMKYDCEIPVHDVLGQKQGTTRETK